MSNDITRVLELAQKARTDENVVDDNYEFLFEYFLSTGEMPYGTAKARTGDPYQWISNKLFQMLPRPL